jgi:hypothetical protein
VALPIHALSKLKPLLKGEVLSLGYPDLDCTAEEVEKLFGYKPTRFNKENKWHGRKDPLPDSEELFEHLGVKLAVVDFVKERGMEIVADLNEAQDFGQFDLVIDPGTLEHCFNIGQALMTAAESVKVGGHILHLSPLNMPNHGFYNISPTLYHDFYSQNGWSAEMKVIARPFTVSPVDRFVVTSEHLVRCLAKRDVGGILKMPIQSKYLKKARK